LWDFVLRKQLLANFFNFQSKIPHLQKLVPRLVGNRIREKLQHGQKLNIFSPAVAVLKRFGETVRYGGVQCLESPETAVEHNVGLKK
jgi:hypothetical protein